MEVQISSETPVCCLSLVLVTKLPSASLAYCRSSVCLSIVLMTLLTNALLSNPSHRPLESAHPHLKLTNQLEALSSRESLW